MLNPLDFVTIEQIEELGLTYEEIINAYQPSKGAVFHARGGEGKAKTLLCIHLIKILIDTGYFKPSDGFGNIALKGKYSYGYEVLKGEKLHEKLWELTHKPLTHKFVIIDEIDSEFPARFFSSAEQTEIALRMWHVQKLDNFVFMTSHKGNSTDLIYHLATHYYLYPQGVDWITNSIDYIMLNNLDDTFEEYTANNVIPTMLIYNRQELTEDTTEENTKQRKKSKTKKEKLTSVDLDFDLDLETEGLTLN